MAVWSILWAFGIFVAFWEVLWSFGILFTVLVFCTKKNLATLLGSNFICDANIHAYGLKK
jgi:hypothetical protein